MPAGLRDDHTPQAYAVVTLRNGGYLGSLLHEKSGQHTEGHDRKKDAQHTCQECSPTLKEHVFEVQTVIEA